MKRNRKIESVRACFPFLPVQCVFCVLRVACVFLEHLEELQV